MFQLYKKCHFIALLLILASCLNPEEPNMSSNCNSDPVLRQTIKQPSYELELHAPREVCIQKLENGSYDISNETAFVRIRNTSKEPIEVRHTNLGLLQLTGVWDVSAPQTVKELSSPGPVNPNSVKVGFQTIPPNGTYDPVPVVIQTISAVFFEVTDGTTLTGKSLLQKNTSPREFGLSFSFNTIVTTAGGNQAVSQTLKTEIKAILLPDLLPK